MMAGLSNRTKQWLGGLVALAALARSPHAQAPSGTRPQFEVASVKRCQADPIGARGGATRSTPDRMTMDCQNVLGLIEAAYVMFADGKRADPATFLNTPVEGGPNWIKSERYSITAKEPDATPDTVMRGPMMQALLEDRFKLRIRRERRDVPVYELTRARGGPKLEPFKEGSCVPNEFPPPFPPPPTPPGQRRCKPDPGASLSPEEQLRAIGPNRVLQFEGVTLVEFTNYVLANPLVGLQRRVVDKTGLPGRFNIRLEYAPPPVDPSRPEIATLQAAAGDPTAPAIETALREQLGLRLEPAKGEGVRFVIESVDRPIEN
jgi:uncharacterized protein (TIGR03435 family)